MPDGTLKYRLVIDARSVNIVTLGEAYIAPTVEESISAMYDAKVFSSYDLKQAYHSIPLTEKANSLQLLVRLSSNSISIIAVLVLKILEQPCVGS